MTMTSTSDKTTERPRTVLAAHARPDFVETASVQQITQRSLAYLAAGYPVHFRGPAGTGKTTLALHVAATWGRSIMMMTGDEAFSTSDLIGNQDGYHYRKIVDRFIHTVVKYEEDAVKQWVDNRLTTACREGFTLIYDEFTRSRPEANNILLGVLEEGLLILPNMSSRDGYIKVHPQFRAIFTSNPQEYAGVHEAQDALSDRLVTIDLDYYDRDTELAITVARSGVSTEAATRIVDIVRDFRSSGEYDQAPTLRASIMISKVIAMQNLSTDVNDPRFVSTCLDILESKTTFTGRAHEKRDQQRKMLLDLIGHHCRGETRQVSSEQTVPAGHYETERSLSDD